MLCFSGQRVKQPHYVTLNCGPEHLLISTYSCLLSAMLSALRRQSSIILIGSRESDVRVWDQQHFNSIITLLSHKILSL